MYTHRTVLSLTVSVKTTAYRRLWSVCKNTTAMQIDYAWELSCTQIEHRAKFVAGSSLIGCFVAIVSN